MLAHEIASIQFFSAENVIANHGSYLRDVTRIAGAPSGVCWFPYQLVKNLLRSFFKLQAQHSNLKQEVSPGSEGRVWKQKYLTQSELINADGIQFGFLRAVIYNKVDERLKIVVDHLQLVHKCEKNLEM